MICPVQVTYSLMVGAILSYGIMWPLIEGKQGDWFPVGKKYSEGGSNTRGLQGYKVHTILPILHVQDLLLQHAMPRRQA